ncbi:hypothetical protein GpartN1_g6396.t1 [Galdieria partita]|uniref:Uncharacterized protein n=1 Tax=Galdieria partita TaxID=83374 RepID=A0A9C7UTL5_9RHOD|nr:hypothetical protein GpartN1_g6396.t1 [Galdieria partita]
MSSQGSYWTLTILSCSVLSIALGWRNWELYKELKYFQTRAQQEIGKIQQQRDDKQQQLNQWKNNLDSQVDVLLDRIEKEEPSKLKTKEEYKQLLKQWIQSSSS